MWRMDWGGTKPAWVTGTVEGTVPGILHVLSPQLDHDLQVRCEEEWSLDFRPKWMVPFPKIETTEGDFEKRRGVLTTLWGEAPVRTPTQNALQAANTGMDVDMDGWMEMVSISLF